MEDIAARAGLAGYLFQQREELGRIEAELEKQASAGIVGMRWGGRP